MNTVRVAAVRVMPPATENVMLGVYIKINEVAV